LKYFKDFKWIYVIIDERLPVKTVTTDKGKEYKLVFGGCSDPLEMWVQLIEKGIYNYSINKCNEKSFIPLWDNMEFIEIYVSKTKNIFSNLKTNSYVKNVSLIEKLKVFRIDVFSTDVS
jgi:hypothetical protein